jgi:hypothetical protein
MENKKEKALRGHPEGFLGGLTSLVVDSGQEQQILSEYDIT